MREILVLRTAIVGADLLRRNGDGSWQEKPQVILDGDVTLESIGFTFELTDAYRTTQHASR